MSPFADIERYQTADFTQNHRQPVRLPFKPYFLLLQWLVVECIVSQGRSLGRISYPYRGTAVNDTLEGNPPPTKTYLIGTLAAKNSTGQATSTYVPNSTSSAASRKDKKTSSAMIALYVIAGVISIVFFFVLILGAYRALRHPERYGRREATDAQGPQSTAGGIAQAILDTFPVVKFTRRERTDRDVTGTQLKRPSSDHDYSSTVLPELSQRDSIVPLNDEQRRQSMALRSLRTQTSASSLTDIADEDASVKSGLRHSRSLITPSGSRQASGYDLHHQALLEQEEGAEDQCPICLVEFEDGDDLRVLPCEKEHVYHQGCIDPWLLQVSSSCPLCRKDFNAPPVSDNPDSSASPSPPSPPLSPSSQPPTQSGFAKYLAFMRRKGRGVTAGGRRRADTHGSGRTIESGLRAGRRREPSS